jgi:hypothetical protein
MRELHELMEFLDRSLLFGDGPEAVDVLMRSQGYQTVFVDDESRDMWYPYSVRYRIASGLEIEFFFESPALSWSRADPVVRLTWEALPRRVSQTGSDMSVRLQCISSEREWLAGRQRACRLMNVPGDPWLAVRSSLLPEFALLYRAGLRIHRLAEHLSDTQEACVHGSRRACGICGPAPACDDVKNLLNEAIALVEEQTKALAERSGKNVATYRDVTSLLRYSASGETATGPLRIYTVPVDADPISVSASRLLVSLDTLVCLCGDIGTARHPADRDDGKIVKDVLGVMDRVHKHLVNTTEQRLNALRKQSLPKALLDETTPAE